MKIQHSLSSAYVKSASDATEALSECMGYLSPERWDALSRKGERISSRRKALRFMRILDRDMAKACPIGS